VEASATVTSKGRVTIPRTVRDQLAIQAGDRITFRVEGQRVVLTRTPELLSLASSIPVPTHTRGATWAEVCRQTRVRRASRA